MLVIKSEDRIDLAYLRADDPANVGSVPDLGWAIAIQLGPIRNVI
jgi:hypothetical protein